MGDADWKELTEFYSQFFQNELTKDDILNVIKRTTPDTHFQALVNLRNLQIIGTEMKSETTEKNDMNESDNSEDVADEIKTEPEIFRCVYDLHGFTRTSAVQFVRRVLMSLVATLSYKVEFIVGKGRHSAGRKPLIKEDVNDICKSLGFKWTESDTNSGRIEVNILASTEPNDKGRYHYETVAVKRNAKNAANNEHKALNERIVKELPPPSPHSGSIRGHPRSMRF